MKLRLTLVDYLNAAPLGWAFLHGPMKDLFEILPAPPSRCADLLASGGADFGIIPSIEYQRIPGLAIIPGAAIAAVDEVRSVVLVRPPGREIRSVALDTHSRTSVVLLRLLLQSRMGLAPELVPHSPDLEGMLRRCDAALLIGDAALQLPVRDYEITDLAREWIAWQKLPFVFALWACRKEMGAAADLAAIIGEAKEWGLARRPEIAALYARKLGLEADFLLEYLTRNIDYSFAPQQVEGLARFYFLAQPILGQNDPTPLRFLPAGPAAKTSGAISHAPIFGG